MVPAELFLRIKLTDDEGNVRDIVIWKVPRSPDSPEGLRYQLAFIPAGERAAGGPL